MICPITGTLDHPLETFGTTVLVGKQLVTPDTSANNRCDCRVPLHKRQLLSLSMKWSTLRLYPTIDGLLILKWSQNWVFFHEPPFQETSFRKAFSPVILPGNIRGWCVATLEKSRWNLTVQQLQSVAGTAMNTQFFKLLSDFCFDSNVNWIIDLAMDDIL